ncbi:MAG: DUF4160 domain-containing protein [Phycisphaeraceae bacterium]
MPKLYEYMGIIVLFYSNEHEPIHVHGKHQGRETRAELVIRDGRVVEIRYGPVRGRRPLDGAVFQDFQTLVTHHADDIVQKWIDYFVLHRRVQPQVITKRIK